MSAALSPFRSLARVFSRMVAGLENRRAAKALMHLDARGLADIGLTRGAVESVFANTSALEDPTPQLSRIATRFGQVAHEGPARSGRESAASPEPEADKRRFDSLPSVRPAFL